MLCGLGALLEENGCSRGKESSEWQFPKEVPACNKRFGKMAGRSSLKGNCSYLWPWYFVGMAVWEGRHLAKPPGR